MESPASPIVVRAQAEIDQLTAAAFATAGIPACGCGRMADGVVATCWPCRSGNTRGGFYCPPTPEDRTSLYGGPTEHADDEGQRGSVRVRRQPQVLWSGAEDAQRIATLEARIAALEAENAHLCLIALDAEEHARDVRRENTALAEHVVYLVGQLGLRSR